MNVHSSHPLNEFRINQLYSCEEISTVKVWLEGAGLALAEEKTKRNYAPIRIDNHIMTFKPVIKYLAMMKTEDVEDPASDGAMV